MRVRSTSANFQGDLAALIALTGLVGVVGRRCTVVEIGSRSRRAYQPQVSLRKPTRSARGFMAVGSFSRKKVAGLVSFPIRLLRSVSTGKGKTSARDSRAHRNSGQLGSPRRYLQLGSLSYPDTVVNGYYGPSSYYCQITSTKCPRLHVRQGL